MADFVEAPESEDAPYDNVKLEVPKQLLEHLNVIAAVDRGGTLTKIVFASRDYCNEDNYELNFVLYENKRFENGLRWMKKKALLPESGSIHITGIGGELYREVIEKVLNLKAVFIDEFITHHKGTHFLLKNFTLDKFTCKDDLSKDVMKEIDFSKLKINKEWASHFKSGEIGENKCPDFPIMLVTVGSAFPYILLNEDGTTQFVGFFMCGGKSFLGLSKLLLGTKDYDDIVNLASKGWRGNVDTQVKDLMKDEFGNYGHMPPDLPMFPFGKASDFNLSIEDLRREDLAHSLVSFFARSLITNIQTSICGLGYKKLRCFVVGNWSRSEIVRREMRRSAMHSIVKDVIELHFVSNGHTGALGAMLNDHDALEPFKSAETAPSEQ